MATLSLPPLLPGSAPTRDLVSFFLSFLLFLSFFLSTDLFFFFFFFCVAEIANLELSDDASPHSSLEGESDAFETSNSQSSERTEDDAE